MERADLLDVQGGCRLEQLLDLGTVLAYNAEVVAPCLAGPLLFNIQGTELAEAVGREKHLVGCIVGYHNLRPVNHRCKHESKLVLTKIQCAAVLNHHLLILEAGAEELCHHGKCLGVANHLCIRIGVHKILYVGGVVRLHVLHYQVVGALASKGLGQVVQPVVGKVDIHGVHHRDFIVKDDIGIVCHSVRYIILTFEEVNLMVIDTHIDDAVSDLLYSAHSSLLNITVLLYHRVIKKQPIKKAAITDRFCTKFRKTQPTIPITNTITNRATDSIRPRTIR